MTLSSILSTCVYSAEQSRVHIRIFLVYDFVSTHMPFITLISHSILIFVFWIGHFKFIEPFFHEIVIYVFFLVFFSFVRLSAPSSEHAICLCIIVKLTPWRRGQLVRHQNCIIKCITIARAQNCLPLKNKRTNEHLYKKINYVCKYTLGCMNRML